MEIVIQRSEDDIAAVVSDAIEVLVTKNPKPVLGLATGSSPLPVYRELIRRHRENGLSFSHVRAFLLDEYVGLAAGHPESYREVIRRDFTGQVDIADEGGVDLQILGIGTNGHLAFNEPGSSLASRTRMETLTEQTRQDNARFFNSIDEVPIHVLTQGLGTILEAKHLVLVATGAGKAAAVAAMIEGPVSAFCPGSVLQLHPRSTIVIDEAAAADLKLADYYRRSYDLKPPRQAL